MADDQRINMQAIRQPQQRLRQTRLTPPNSPPPTCPRCYSNRNRFCYYNNMVLSQPRYFCKNCRRFWTHVGRLVRTIIPPTDKPIQNPHRVKISSSVYKIVESPSISAQLPSIPSSVPPPVENQIHPPSP